MDKHYSRAIYILLYFKGVPCRGGILRTSFVPCRKRQASYEEGRRIFFATWSNGEPFGWTGRKRPVLPAVVRRDERDMRRRSACGGTTVGRKFALYGAERKCGFRVLKRPDGGRGGWGRCHLSVCRPSVGVLETRRKTSIGKSRTAGRNSSECDGPVHVSTEGLLSALSNDGCRPLQGEVAFGCGSVAAGRLRGGSIVARDWFLSFGFCFSTTNDSVDVLVSNGGVRKVSEGKGAVFIATAS